MTSFQTRRCHHCKSPYSFQASGHGCLDEPNSDRYCPTCWLAIIRTLSEIPQRYDSEWVSSDDHTVEELVAIEKRRMEDAEKAGAIPFRRVLMPLFDMSDGENDNRNGVVEVDGKTYSYSYWTKMHDGDFAPKVHILMQKDLMTGDMEPWRDFR